MKTLTKKNQKQKNIYKLGLKCEIKNNETFIKDLRKKTSQE
jgi:hypothetical protein